MAAAAAPRTGDSVMVSDVCSKKILPKVTTMFPSGGVLYIVSNPCWQGVLKFGKTKHNDLKRRFHNYNTTSPHDIEPRAVIVCKDVDRLEDHVKMFVGPYLIDDTRLEWVRMPEEQLLQVVMRFVVKDEMLSAELGHTIYDFAEHDCAQCFAAIPRSHSLRFAHLISSLQSASEHCSMQRRSEPHLDTEMDTGTAPELRFELSRASQWSAPLHFWVPTAPSSLLQQPEHSSRSKSTQPLLMRLRAQGTACGSSHGKQPVSVDALDKGTLGETVVAAILEEHSCGTAANRRRGPARQAGKNKDKTLLGVFFDGIRNRWVGYAGTGRNQRKTFAVGKYGNEQAKQLAFKFRREKKPLDTLQTAETSSLPSSVLPNGVGPLNSNAGADLKRV